VSRGAGATLARRGPAALLALALAGCGALLGPTANERWGRPQLPPPTRARLTLTPADVPAGVFVGVALSGGGSRSANFAAAALFELERLGLLPGRVTALSSVSGSSLATAYYGLHAGGPGWEPAAVRRLLATDFERPWIVRWFLPHNIVRYWLATLTRSDIMAGVFDDVLFQGRTFAAMPPGGPRILLNATALGDAGVPFVFADERFANRGSRLDTFPVAHAVMASAAFPAAFTSVTLETFGDPAGPRRFLHVYDGGPADNLGITTLLDLATDAAEPGPDGRPPAGPRGCFLVVVDAHTTQTRQGLRDQTRRSPRRLLDFFVDQNVLDASTVLLSQQRRAALADLGVSRPGLEPIGVAELTSRRRGRERVGECTAWVLTFERLWGLAVRLGGERERDLQRLAEVVNGIETRFILTGDPALGPAELQASLWRAAAVLARDDEPALAAVCAWFAGRGIALAACPAGRRPPA
jgi:predicted acylesterase/phospholipase RssA